MSASRVALRALVLRDLVVLRKHFGEFVVRTLIQPFLLVFVFLYVFPSIGQGIGGGGGKVAESHFATVLVPGVVGISIMFQGIQAVALQLSTEFGYTREIEDRVQAPCPIWLVALSKVLSGAAQGLLAAVIVFPIAAVVHAPGVHAHLTVHWWVVLTLIPLACVTMTSLGLLLGTAFEPRNIGLMFGFVVLPLTFLGGTYYQWTKLSPVTVDGVHWLQILVLDQPPDLRQRGHARGADRSVAHAPVCRLSGADRLLRGVPCTGAAQVPRSRAVVKPKLLIVIASTRPGRVGLPVGSWFEGYAQAHGAFDVEVADLLEVNLPLMDEPNHPRLAQYTHKHTRDWGATVKAADAFAFVMPEYNYSLTAPLKNAIDYLHNEWQYRPVGFVSYGGISGGMRAVQMVKQVVTTLKMTPLPEAVTIQFVAKLINDDSEFVPSETIEHAATAMLDELLRVGAALSVLRGE